MIYRAQTSTRDETFIIAVDTTKEHAEENLTIAAMIVFSLPAPAIKLKNIQKSNHHIVKRMSLIEGERGWIKKVEPSSLKQRVGPKTLESKGQHARKKLSITISKEANDHLENCQRDNENKSRLVDRLILEHKTMGHWNPRR